MSRNVDIEKCVVALLEELNQQGVSVDTEALLGAFYDTAYPSPQKWDKEKRKYFETGKRAPYAERCINKVWRMLGWVL